MPGRRQGGFFLLAALGEVGLAVLLVAAATLSFAGGLSLLHKQRSLQAALGYGQLLLWSAGEEAEPPPGLDFQVGQQSQGSWSIREVKWSHGKEKEAGSLYLVLPKGSGD